MEPGSFRITLRVELAYGHDPRSAGLAHKHGPRVMVTIGLLLAATGLIVMGTVQPSTHYGIIVLPLILMAAGQATLMPPSTSCAL